MAIITNRIINKIGKAGIKSALKKFPLANIPKGITTAKAKSRHMTILSSKRIRNAPLFLIENPANREPKLKFLPCAVWAASSTMPPRKQKPPNRKTDSKSNSRIIMVEVKSLKSAGGGAFNA